MLSVEHINLHFYILTIKMEPQLLNLHLLRSLLTKTEGSETSFLITMEAV